MKRYFNMLNNYGIETVDKLDSKDFKTLKEFRIELKRLVSEYIIAGMNVYTSQRCTKDWNKND